MTKCVPDVRTVTPIVTLRLGSTLKADDIKEGDDVYFECHVKANPPWKKLNWLHNVSMKTPYCVELRDVIVNYDWTRENTYS